jgi:hypothetical protein
MSGSGAIFLFIILGLLVAAWWQLAGMLVSIFDQRRAADENGKTGHSNVGA